MVQTNHGEKKTPSLIEELLDLIRQEMQQTGYGFFPGGDPRLFTPDGENSDEEKAAHKADCEAWDRGEKGNSKNMSGKTIHDEQGKTFIHMQPSGYGTGVYTIVDPWVQELYDKALKIQETYQLVSEEKNIDPNGDSKGFYGGTA